MDRKPVVRKEVRARDVFFTVSWSRLRKSDKYEIVKSVPSEAGVYELYYMDEKQKLCLFHVGKSWYGGLRNEIRVRTDVELEKDESRRALLEDHDCWYRWSLISNSDDMADILYFFAQTYLPGTLSVHHSGRYERIFVKEQDADKIVTI
ncbi:MAG: hypothetical protein ABSF77_20875 [Spirochaetia bacterium]